MSRHLSAALIAAAFLVGCSRTDGIVPPATGGGTTTSPASKGAKLTVIIPRLRASYGRHAKYVSPSSAKLLVGVNKRAATTYGLTPQSPGCTQLQNNVTCTFEIVAAAGTDALSLTIEDANGAVLSRNVVSVKLKSGVETPVSVTLDAVPATVAAVPGVGSGLEGSASPAYHAPGLVSEPIELEAFDADGNVIVGPGAPVISQPTLSSLDSNYASVVSANSNDPNAYLLKPKSGISGGHTVAVSATAQSLPLGNGTQGSVITGTTNFLFTPALALGAGRFVSEYSLETGALIATFNVCAGACAVSIIHGLASDADGNIWAAYESIAGVSNGFTVEEFPPNATGFTTVLTSSNGVTGAQAIATGPNDMLYVANAAAGFFGHRTPASITEYAKGATSPTYMLKDANITGPAALAVDPLGDVYVANQDGTIPVYGPGASQPPLRTLSDPSVQAPASMVLDRAGGLYVDDDDQNNSAFYIAYFPPGSTTVGQTLNDSSFSDTFVGLTTDPQGDLIASLLNNNETEILAAGALPNAVQITSTISAPGFPAWIP